jgi:hypothetical protein
MTDPLAQIDDEVIGCLLSERDYAIRSEELAGGLFAMVDEVVELPDGYAYRFSGAESPLESLLEFIAAERRCCPFLSFEIAFEPRQGPLWLRMRGSPRVKSFIAETFQIGAAVPVLMDASRVS